MTNTQSNTQDQNKKQADQAKASPAPQQSQSMPRTPSEQTPQQQK